jgi:hypothetical protein
MGKTIPTKDSDFNMVSEVITEAVSQNQTAWNIDSEWYNGEVMAAKTEWTAAWSAYQNPAGRTPLITFTKTEKRTAYEKLLRQLVQNLQYNPKVSEDDLRAMGIVIHSTSHTPVPVPTTYPDFTVDTGTLRRLTVNFHDHGKEKRAKPAGVSGAVIHWAVLDAPPVNVEALHNSVLDTASPYTLEFSDEQRGSKVYFCLAWQNTRGEKGPWSEFEMAIVP